VPVDAVSFAGAQDRVLAWGHARESRYVVLYLVKSALGIDLIPGFSFGVWGWFQENVL
jgi:hypothetical protein